MPTVSIPPEIIFLALISGALRIIPSIVIYACAVFAIVQLILGRRPYWSGAVAAVGFVAWVGLFAHARLYYSAPDPIVAEADTKRGMSTEAITLFVKDTYDAFPDLDYTLLYDHTPIRRVIRIDVNRNSSPACTGTSYLALDVRPGLPRERNADWHPVAELPKQYVVLDKCEAAAHPGAHPHGGAYKTVSEVDGETSILRNVYFRRAVPDPTFPPVFLLTGLVENSDSDIQSDPDHADTNFVIRALTPGFSRNR